MYEVLVSILILTQQNYLLYCCIVTAVCCFGSYNWTDVMWRLVHVHLLYHHRTQHRLFHPHSTPSNESLDRHAQSSMRLCVHRRLPLVVSWYCCMVVVVLSIPVQFELVQETCVGSKLQVLHALPYVTQDTTPHAAIFVFTPK